MANVETVSVVLSPEMASRMREAVTSGEYVSASQVIHEALCEWSFRRTRRGQALEELGRLWDEGMASGDAVDGGEAFARIKSTLAARIAERTSR